MRGGRINTPPPEPVDEQAELEAWLEEQERDDKRRSLLSRGWAEFTRCVGGFVDRVSGEFFETPWRAEFFKGVLRVWPKEAAI